MCVKHDILATLSYFDIFHYPLTQTEAVQFLQTICTQKEIATALTELEEDNWIFKFDEFYTLQNNYSLIPRRRKGNIKARQMLHTATKNAALLSRFPFVQGVAVSGSLSKTFADETSDIDFFIITKKNRLWLARTFMHCFKKLTFLLGRQDQFCMNYYVDEEMLQIKEKNIYTAIEVATLMPLRGIESFNNFYTANKWISDFLPNHSMRISYVEEIKSSLLKKMLELIFDHSFGNLIDHLLMKITSAKWAVKTRMEKRNKNGIIMSMDAAKHYAKPKPENFQHQLLHLYENKVATIFRRYEKKLKRVH